MFIFWSSEKPAVHTGRLLFHKIKKEHPLKSDSPVCMMFCEGDAYVQNYHAFAEGILQEL